MADGLPPSYREGADHWATSARNRAFEHSQWQLSLRVYAHLDGWHAIAYVYRWGEDNRMEVAEIARASWKGRAAGATTVVQWGSRALEKWLGENLPQTD